MADAPNEDEPLTAVAVAAPFGPSFFLGPLRAFARERCPDPQEGLPAVEVHLATGEALDLCHVAGLAPGFAALAVRERCGADGPVRMRTELVPYGYIVRVTVRPARADAPRLGFDVAHDPRILTEGLTPEETLRAAAAEPHSRPSR